MRFINYYITKAKPYALYIAIAAGIIAVGGIGSYVYFNFFHDPNAKSSNNNNTSVNNTSVNNTPVNNTPVNNTPVNNTPIANNIPQTIPQTVE
jgi:spore germination protein GerM